MSSLGSIPNKRDTLMSLTFSLYQTDVDVADVLQAATFVDSSGFFFYISSFSLLEIQSVAHLPISRKVL